jgi:hypothetical protein
MHHPAAFDRAIYGCHTEVVRFLQSIKFAAVAALVSANCAAASATPIISGSIQGSHTKGSFQATFQCTGTPTCTGSYTATVTALGCSNKLLVLNTITLTQFDLSNPGTQFSGSAIFARGDFDLRAAANGTCSIVPGTQHDFTTAYVGIWNGSSGVFLPGSGCSTPGASCGGGPTTFDSRTYEDPLDLTVSGSIDADFANVSATAQVRPEDVIAGARFFIFALARPSQLASAMAANNAKDDVGGCVLAQLGPNGQLVAVSASGIQPSVTGLTTAQTQSLTILGNVPTSGVANTTFFVGYGTSPGGMLATGFVRSAVTVPGPQPCPATLINSPGTLSGIWWNANESGWGIHLTERHAMVFATWYTYDAAGNPKWYTSTCAAHLSISNTTYCDGPLYEVGGPLFFGAPFDASRVSVTSPGALHIVFQDVNTASMTYTLGGQSRSVAISRQPLASGTVPPAIDHTDLWWNPSESGWGLAIAQQYGVMFLAWYVYDSAGKPVWYVATCNVDGASCSGSLQRTTGPSFGPTFNPEQVRVFAAGTIAVDFTDANNAVLRYNVGGTSGSKSLTRQLF